MNKILTISVLLGVTVMMMSSILPTMAEPSAQADEHVKGHVGGGNDKHPTDCESGVAKAEEESGKKIPAECPEPKTGEL